MTPSLLPRQLTLACIVALTLLGAAVRLGNLNQEALRGDEAFTVLHWMREPLAQTIANIATVDPQGPFNYALYRAYALTVGSDPAIVRFLPALLSIAGVPLLYVLGVRFGGGARVGLIAAALWAISPVALYHAQDARSYAIWAITSPLALWLALRAIQRPLGRINWVLYIAAATLALYTYYLEAFVVIALNLGLLTGFALAAAQRRPFLRLAWRWFASQIVIALLILPWYAQPRLLSGGGYTGTTTGFDLRYFIERFIPSLLYGEHPAFHTVWFGVGVIVILAIYLLRRAASLTLWKTLPLLLVVVPTLGIIVASTRLNIFAPRYILSASVVLVVITAFVIDDLAAPLMRRRGQPEPKGVGWVMSAVGLVLCVLSFVGAYHLGVIDYAKSPQWRELSAYLAARVDPDDLVIQAAADEAFTLYCQEYTITADCDLKLPANPRQTSAEIESFLTTRSATARAIWYVAQPQAGWENRTAALDWLHATMQPVLTTQIGSLPVTQFMPYTVRADEMATPPLGTFEALLTLQHAETAREPDGLHVRLIWTPLSQSQDSLKFFVHLLDASGGLIAQDDQFPQDGRLDSRQWPPDVAFRDTFVIPLADRVPEGAILAVGVYNPADLTRLSLPNGADAIQVALTPDS